MKVDEPESSTDKSGDDAKKDTEKEKSKPKMKEKELKALEEPRKSVSVETECYIHLMVLIFLSDLSKFCFVWEGIMIILFTGSLGLKLVFTVLSSRLIVSFGMGKKVKKTFVD